jgi:hypothetical protein
MGVGFAVEIKAFATLFPSPVTPDSPARLHTPPLASLGLDTKRFRFLDRPSQVALYLAFKLFQKVPLSLEALGQTGLCLGIDQATFISNQAHGEKVEAPPLSPALFSMTLPNIPSAVVSMAYQILGPQYTFSSGVYCFLHALEQAQYLLEERECCYVLCGTLSCFPEHWKNTGEEFALFFLLEGSSSNRSNQLSFSQGELHSFQGNSVRSKTLVLRQESDAGLQIYQTLQERSSPFQLVFPQGEWAYCLKFSGDLPK